jgi:hypothetical protein
LLTPRLCAEFSSNYTLLTTMTKGRPTCLFSGLLAAERLSKRSLFILSLSRECDFPEVVFLGFGMKAERVEIVE